MFVKLNDNKIYQKLYLSLKDTFLYGMIKKLLANSAKFSNGNPSASIFVIGITGTSGKTITSNLLHHILNRTTAKSILISSYNIKIGNDLVKGYENKKRMTSYEINTLLAMAKNMDCKIAILDLDIINLSNFVYEGIQFDAGILTNCGFSNDDLNSHKYTKILKKLFQYILQNNKQNKFVVFPKDDVVGRQRAEELPFDKKITFSINSSSVLKATNIIEDLNGISFSFSYLGKIYNIKSQLCGGYNAYNILSAIGLCIEMGLSIDEIIKTINSFSGLKNRMELFTKNKINIFFNIINSEISLQKSLDFLYNLKQKYDSRLILIFSPIINNTMLDNSKLGNILQQYNDILIISENKNDYKNRLNEIYNSSRNITMKEGDNFFIIPEKEFAIKFAIEIAKQGDFILLIGQEHKQSKLNIKDKNIKIWDDKKFILKKYSWK